MNRHQVKGTLKDAAGKLQEGAGRATGNPRHEGRGEAMQQEGKVQKKAGDLKQGVKKIVRKP